ncbi:hypothetical protein HK100_007804 [Physocladia obscura]|uniref:Uncharacterized protein n=1 Tax=Physocladia obscura TaxID=109957 RepID=A0AAD5SNV8_9FUNG|nr:hypothetical protein HK100_007804 [Physocladia obscura]
MGNDASKQKGGHTLGGSSSSSSGGGENKSASTTANTNHAHASAASSAGGVGAKLATPSSRKPVPATSDHDREQRLAAVEARIGAQEKRGVQKGGGKLAAKLQDSNRSARNDPVVVGGSDDVVDMWKN